MPPYNLAVWVRPRSSLSSRSVGDLFVFEPFRQLGLPDFSAAGIGGCDQAERGDVVGVFLALAYPYRLGRWAASNSGNRYGITVGGKLVPTSGHPASVELERCDCWSASPAKQQAARVLVDVADGRRTVRLCAVGVAVVGVVGAVILSAAVGVQTILFGLRFFRLICFRGDIGGISKLRGNSTDVLRRR